jgi:hypothetical protein
MIVLDVMNGTPARTDQHVGERPFTSWLLASMARKGVKNNELAQRLTAREPIAPVSPSMVSGWRKGTLPERENSDRLAEYFHADPDEVWALRRDQERLRTDAEDALHRGRHRGGVGPTGAEDDDLDVTKPPAVPVHWPAVVATPRPAGTGAVFYVGPDGDVTGVVGLDPVEDGPVKDFLARVRARRQREAGGADGGGEGAPTPG